MEFKGTKGKWLINDTNHDIFGGLDNYNQITAGEGIYNYLGNMQSGFNLSGYLSKENTLLISKAPELLEAIQEFCDRVDKGEVRSTKTYNKFKQLIKEATEL